MEKTDIYEINQNADFSFCNTLTEATLSEAFKLWFISVLKGWLMIPNREVNKIYTIYLKLTNWDPIDEEEFKIFENILSNEILKKFWDEYIKENLSVLKTVTTHKITSISIKWILMGYLIKAKINKVLNDTEYKLTEDEIINKDDEIWEIIVENKNTCAYKLNKKYFILDKKSRKITEYDCISTYNSYWFKTTKWEHVWALNNKWEEIIPCIYDDLLFDERFWFKAVEKGLIWVLDKYGVEIIPCKYDVIEYNDWYFSVTKWVEKWIIHFSWTIVVKPEYDEIIYIKGIWFSVKKWEFYWFIDLWWFVIIDCQMKKIEYINWVWLLVNDWKHEWFYNMKLKQEIEFIFDQIRYSEKIWFYVRKWEQWWVFNKKYELILPCSYDIKKISHYETEEGLFIKVKRPFYKKDIIKDLNNNIAEE